MSEAETILREVRSLREFVATLDRRVKAGSAPRPINGKWPLSVVVDWEMQQKGKNN